MYSFSVSWKRLDRLRWNLVVFRDSLARRFANVWGGIHLHVRTCARADVPLSYLGNIFYKPFHTSFPHRSWKLYPKIISGQVTSSDQVTLRPKIFATPQWVQFLTDQHSLNFQELIEAPAPVRRISRNHDFSDLRSCRPSDLTIIGQWENVQMLFIPKIRNGVC